MDAKKSNKIREIVRLQQILKKWRKLANANSKPTTTTTISNNNNNNSNNNSSNKGIKFLKKTLSFSDNSSVSSVSGTEYVPKGYLAVCVGKELKRYVIPTVYLGHPAFGFLLREAEEEFGFQQEGVLKIPCDVSIFDRVLKMVEMKMMKKKRDNTFDDHHHHHDDSSFLHYQHFNNANDFDVLSSSNLSACCSPDLSDHLLHPYPQLCR